MLKQKLVIENAVEDCKYIDDVICALCGVTSKYVLYPYCENENGEKQYKYPERVFAYEFYHQYRMIMEKNPEKYSGLYLNGEQQKSSQVWKGLAKITPDIVLHKHIDKPDYTGESQKWLCEIKMQGNPNIIDDIKKIKEKEAILKFSDYIFMYIGSNLDNFKNVLNDANLSLTDVLIHTICICAVYSDKETSIACKRLSGILK
ncbi:MAG: hypothetical protein IKQ59_02890 [Prevotella sp.]|nr:hypothetical protein [Prevotella sp.]